MTQNLQRYGYIDSSGRALWILQIWTQLKRGNKKIFNNKGEACGPMLLGDIKPSFSTERAFQKDNYHLLNKYIRKSW